MGDVFSGVHTIAGRFLSDDLVHVIEIHRITVLYSFTLYHTSLVPLAVSDLCGAVRPLLHLSAPAAILFPTSSDSFGKRGLPLTTSSVSSGHRDHPFRPPLCRLTSWRLPGLRGPSFPIPSDSMENAPPPSDRLLGRPAPAAVLSAFFGVRSTHSASRRPPRPSSPTSSESHGKRGHSLRSTLCRSTCACSLSRPSAPTAVRSEHLGGTVPPSPSYFRVFKFRTGRPSPASPRAHRWRPTTRGGGYNLAFGGAITRHWAGPHTAHAIVSPMTSRPERYACPIAHPLSSPHKGTIPRRFSSVFEQLPDTADSLPLP